MEDDRDMSNALLQADGIPPEGLPDEDRQALARLLKARHARALRTMWTAIGAWIAVAGLQGTAKALAHAGITSPATMLVIFAITPALILTAIIFTILFPAFLYIARRSDTAVALARIEARIVALEKEMRQRRGD